MHVLLFESFEKKKRILYFDFITSSLVYVVLVTAKHFKKLISTFLNMAEKLRGTTTSKLVVINYNIHY
jgi:hypothetical protein